MFKSLNITFSIINKSKMNKLFIFELYYTKYVLLRKKLIPVLAKFKQAATYLGCRAKKFSEVETSV